MHPVRWNFVWQNKKNMNKEMFQQIFATESSWISLLLRLTLGLVLFPHGAQKMFGWFNGPGFTGEMDYLTKTVGLSAFTSLMVILIEFFGSLMLIAGFATRIAALGVLGLFIGIIVKVHYKDGFFMNWFGQLQAGQEGYEYHLLIIGLAIAIIIGGGGKFSMDRLF